MGSVNIFFFKKRALKNTERSLDPVAETREAGNAVGAEAREVGHADILARLDPEAIREQLQGHQTRTNILLLQALRWVRINIHYISFLYL